MGRVAGCAACFVVLMAGRRAHADDAGPTVATMTCDPVPGPGRVRCVVDARVADGESISWGDVILVVVPSFLSALRGRIGPHDATVQEAAHWRWGLALVAHGPASGVVEGRVRLVVCRGALCEPRQVPIAGAVVVGE